MRRSVVCAASLLLLLSACGTSANTDSTTTVSTTVAPVITTTTTSAAAPTTAPASTTTTTLGRPHWLGTRPLPLLEDGTAAVLPTPEELVDRRIGTIDRLPAPTDDGFHWTIGDVPADVAERSTWHEECPVALEDLSYLTLSFWGFDGRNHTGELIVNAAHAEAVAEVFAALHESRFPIEEMRVVSAIDLVVPPTGDGNNTTSFSCRNVVFSDHWSQHAYGLAIDINPFHNPYADADRVLPELASAYLDRENVRPGMIVAGDVVTTAFDEIGWSWGGDWRSLVDYMHFSAGGN